MNLLNRLYVGLLFQGEVWRAGDGRWSTIKGMNFYHLKGVRSYLEEYASRYYRAVHYDDTPPEYIILSGDNPSPPSPPRLNWMMSTPVYQAIDAEIKKLEPKTKYLVSISAGGAMVFNNPHETAEYVEMLLSEQELAPKGMRVWREGDNEKTTCVASKIVAKGATEAEAFEDRQCSSHY